MGNIETMELPTVAEIEEELHRVRYKNQFQYSLRSTIYILITVAAFALLIATLVLPVLQVYGVDMEPVVTENSIVVATKTGSPKRGDVLAFYYNNKILIRRVIGLPGDEVEITEGGRVSINGNFLNEPYVSELDLGVTDQKYPLKVPGGKYFVMGDQRLTSLDSRVTVLGSINEEDFIGVVRMCVWPLQEIRLVKSY